LADKTADDDLELKPADAGTMFRMEMFATNVLLGYWKHMLAVVVVVLLSILLYGQYRDYYRRTQRSTAALVADQMAKLPDMAPGLSEKVARGETIDKAQLETVGDEIVAIANGATGTARVEGLLTAAELFRLAQKVEKQRGALEGAAGASEGVLAFAAEEGLANLELGVGEGEKAVERLRKLAETHEGFLAEQAMLDLGLALEHLGKPGEADKLYSEFLTKFPESLRADEVKQRQARVAAAAGGGAG
jgi:tetratricopeptide (TPR) repeat protein